jgi:prepilin-type N-terminal cleavage/methylation domain-containing protein
MRHPAWPARERRGFTLVETIATLALLCFIVVVLGPLLLRVSRQSSTVTAGQYRTAAMVGASSWVMTIPANQLLAQCDTVVSQAFPYSACLGVTDTLPGLRRVRVVVEPGDSFLLAPDTVTLYRVNQSFTNPFNTP